MIDIDKVDWPVAIDPITDPDGAIKYLREACCRPNFET